MLKGKAQDLTEKKPLKPTRVAISLYGECGGQVLCFAFSANQAWISTPQDLTPKPDVTKQASLTAFPFLVLRFNATPPQNNPLQSRSYLRR